jgi:hypothetical protein
MTAQQPHRELRKAILREPHKATALTDGWLCFKYLDNGEESLSTFADISKGDVITYSHPHTPAPKSGCDGCRKDTEHLECPVPGKCDQMKCPICCEGSDFPTLPQEIAKYEAEAARAATLAAYEELIELNRQTTGRTKEEIRDILFICQINPTKWLQSLLTTAQQEREHP